MTASTTLDPRAPLVLDTRELGRRPGAMTHVRREFPAPADWALELVRVPAGAVAELDVRLESVVDGVLVTGGVHAPVVAECGRCLEPVDTAIDVDVQELFAYEPDEDGDEQPLMVGDLLDLSEIVRDSVVLGLPLNPLCDEDCQGLCATCGVRLDDVEDNHEHEQDDPRWAALQTLDGATSPTMMET